MRQSFLGTMEERLLPGEDFWKEGLGNGQAGAQADPFKGTGTARFQTDGRQAMNLVEPPSILEHLYYFDKGFG